MPFQRRGGVTFLLASRNPHKGRELRRLLRGVPVRVLTLSRFPRIRPAKERGATFRANAVEKAVRVSKQTILPVLGEDSGLEVRALGGRPGVRSARFACPEPRRRACPARSDRANNGKLLKALAGVSPSGRQARFVCVMALGVGGRLIRTFEGRCAGWIALKAAGRGGFGYDVVFIPAGRDRTMAELRAAEKDRLSHRGKAARALAEWVRKSLRTDPGG